MNTKVRKARAKKEVKRALRKIAPEDAQNILASEVETVSEKTEQVKERVPGQVVEGSKTTWTWRDLCERYPIVEIHPEETERFTWNGILIQLIAGATHYVPEPIRDAFLHHRKQLRSTGKSLPDLGFETVIELGAGALEPE